MNILDVSWSYRGPTEYKELGSPGGNFKLLHGSVFTGQFKGHKRIIHVCLDDDREGRLDTIIDTKESAVLELSNRFLDEAQGTNRLFHNGAMTVRTRLTNARVINHVEKECPALIDTRRVFLGKLQKHPGRWSLIDIPRLAKNEPKFLKRLLAYSLIRQQLKTSIQGQNKITKNPLPENSPSSHIKHGLGGESKGHRELKEYIASHPRCLGLPTDFRGEVEKTFATGDRADIVFVKNARIVAVVEVEVHPDGTWVGLLQALKYRTLALGEQRGSLNNRRVKGFLAAPEIPSSIRDLAFKWGVGAVEVQIPIPKLRN